MGIYSFDGVCVPGIVVSCPPKPQTPGVFYIAEGDLGLGLFASHYINPGDDILHFGGPLIDFNAAVAKGEKQCYPLQVAANLYIDLEEPGCYANHSCEPNAGIRNLILKALVGIQPGEEIRYDYSTTMDEDYWEMPCLCGAPTCRERVTDFKYLCDSLREKYLMLGIVQPHTSTQYSGRRFFRRRIFESNRERNRARILSGL